MSCDPGRLHKWIERRREWMPKHSSTVHYYCVFCHSVIVIRTKMLRRNPPKSLPSQLSLSLPYVPKAATPNN